MSYVEKDTNVTIGLYVIYRDGGGKCVTKQKLKGKKNALHIL